MIGDWSRKHNLYEMKQSFINTSYLVCRVLPNHLHWVDVYI
jgi:hypothetical protein